MVAVVLALVFVIMVELAKLSCLHQFQMNFVLGNIYNFPLKTIWNSPKALEICTFSQIEKRDTNSPCKHCKVIDICRKSINRRVCFVDISKTLGKGYFDYPDPRCPNSTVTDYIL